MKKSPRFAATLCAALLVSLPVAGWAANGDGTDPPAAADPLTDEGFLSAPLEGDGSAEDPSLSPDDIATVSRIERYLNGLTTVRARFVQLSSEGNVAEGELYIQRPGKMRFEYDPPSPVLLIADGSSLLYYDKELKSATFIPLRETPLWLLSKPTITLGEQIEISRIFEDRSTITVTVRGEDAGEAGEVTLVFTDQPMSLRKWIVTDAQGISTQVALIDPRFDIEVADELFQYGDLDVYGLDRAGPRK